jgi:hypothetical protein
MKYMINVDLDKKNVRGGSMPCESEMHARLGAHHDLTVHALGCSTRKRQKNGEFGVNRRPIRWWDHGDEAGYTLEEVVERIRLIQGNRSPEFQAISKAEGNRLDSLLVWKS